MNTESNTRREMLMYKSLLEGDIPDDCDLGHLGIKVKKNKIVTPGVKFLFQNKDKRHVTVLLYNECVGKIFYKEESDGYIVFNVYNDDQQPEGNLNSFNMNTDSNTQREILMYKSLLEGDIPNACYLGHLGIKVEKNKIVTPGVKFLYQDNDKRQVTVFLDNNRVGSIFYKEESNGYIVFKVFNNNYDQQPEGHNNCF